MQTKKLASPSAPAATFEHDLARLRTLLPLRHLTDADFDALAAHVVIESKPPGQEVFRVGSDEDWLLYLLDGELDIEDASGDRFSISAGTIEALHPITPHPKARVRGIAHGFLRYVRLPVQLVKRQPRMGSPGIQVDEISEQDDGVDNQLLFAVYHELREERLILPSLPDVAMRIRAAAADERKGIAEIAQIVLIDPAITSYCIRVANSAA